MEKISIQFAKTFLSKILTKVRQGEEVIISNRGNPIAKIVPYSEKKSRKDLIGSDNAIVITSEDFAEPLDKKFLESFYE